MKTKTLAAVGVVLALSAVFTQASPLGAAFTYQGQLSVSGTPANGSYDLKFTLYDDASGGMAVAGPLTNSPVGVTNGLFTAKLDFGAGVFTGEARWLEISVRITGGGDFTMLDPRQALTPTPYARFAPNAGAAITAGSADSVVAENISGRLALSQMPAVVLTNNSSGITLDGTFTGNGTGLTSLDAVNLSSGTVADARLSGNVALRDANQTFTGANLFNHAANTFAGTFTGDGAGLTNLSAGGLTGTIPEERLSTNVALLNANQSFTGLNVFSGNVGIGKTNPATALEVGGSITATGLVVNGSAQITGLLRSGSEMGTAEPPSPAGLIIRRINSSNQAAGQVVARTDTMTLERDGSPGGFNLRFTASPGYFMASAMMTQPAGSLQYSYATSYWMQNPGPTVYPFINNGWNIMYFHCTFGRVDGSGHLTEVSLARYPGPGMWFGTVTSTFNQ